MVYLRVLCKFHVAERTKNVLSLITTPFTPCNLMPTSNFKDCKVDIYFPPKNPPRLQAKYLNNNPFICKPPLLFLLPSSSPLLLLPPSLFFPFYLHFTTSLGLQMNELLLRYLPCSRADLFEQKWILT